MRIEEFQDNIQKDLAWRKKEISQLYRVLNTTKTKETIGKTMILLLYAHWEGFIKRSSKYYLKYVSDKNIKVKKLTRNFEALMLKRNAHDCMVNDSFNLSKEFVLLSKQRKTAEKPFKLKISMDNEFDRDYIDTHHNLSSSVLEDIIQIIGVRYNDAIKTRKQFVDIYLLRNRNAIGHGNKITVGDDEDEASVMEYEQIKRLKSFVVLMLDYFAEVLLRYVEDEYYLIHRASERDVYEEEQEKALSKKLDSIEKEKKGA